MQHFTPDNSQTRTKVSSHRHNEAHRDIHADMSEIYRLALQVDANNKVLSDQISALELANLANDLLVSLNNNNKINITNQLNYDRILYPVISETEKRCQFNSEFNGWTLFQIANDRQLIFFNAEKNIYEPLPLLQINRKLLPGVREAFDNKENLDNVLTQGPGYFVKCPNTRRAGIELVFWIPEKEIEANIIRVQQFPASNAVSIEKLQIEDSQGNIKTIILNDGTIFSLDDKDEVNTKSKSFYLPIQRIKFNKLRIHLRSLLYNTESESSFIGLSRLLIQNIVFASESVIGFEIPMEEKEFINNLEILHPEFTGLNDQLIEWSIYDNRDNFNNMNARYVARNKSNIRIDTDTAFVLVKLKRSALDTTPAIQGISYNLG